MDNQTQPNPTPLQETSPELVKPVVIKQNPLVPILIVLVVLLLGVTGFLAYQNMQLQKQISGTNVTQNNVTYASPSPSATSNSVSNWKTYTNSTVGYTINYPSDWAVTLATPSPENAAQGNNTTTITVAKDNYKLSVTTSSLGGGGTICNFDDSTKDEFHGPATDQLGAPYSIGTFLGKPARRNLNPITALTQYGMLRQTLDYTYEACIPLENDLQHTDGKLGYTSTINANNLIVYNAYYTPRENINTESLKTMDQIISSFKFTN